MYTYVAAIVDSTSVLLLLRHTQALFLCVRSGRSHCSWFMCSTFPPARFLSTGIHRPRGARQTADRSVAKRCYNAGIHTQKPSSVKWAVFLRQEQLPTANVTFTIYVISTWQFSILLVLHTLKNAIWHTSRVALFSQVGCISQAGAVANSQCHVHPSM
jgi:hypothetical protein